MPGSAGVATPPLTFGHSLPSGQGGASPSTVADAMLGAVTDFVRKKQPKYMSCVRIVIFQKEMVSDFHNSMVKMQGEAVKSKGVLNIIKGSKNAVTLGPSRQS